MPSIFEAHFQRSEIRKHPDRFYVFGDNLERRGYGGQAKECRGEQNCIGIPTKKKPSNTRQSFFTDDDLDLWIYETRQEWLFLGMAIQNGLTVVWPANGLGTGRAQLEDRAPLIWKALQARMRRLGAIKDET